MILPKDSEENYLIDGNYINVDMFSDIVPYFPDNKTRVFKINSTEKYSKLMSLFRGILNVEEVSYRALAITTAVILENPFDVAAFWLRKKCVEKLEISNEHEETFIKRVLATSPKSYQLWEYRYWFVTERKKSFSLENFENDVFSDKRNFHAWNFLVKITKYFGCHKETLDVTSSFISKDSKNNSAWCARNTIFEESKELLNSENELVFAMSKISQYGGNEAVCNYLRYIVSKKPKNIKVLFDKLTEMLTENPYDRSLLTLGIDLAIQEGLDDIKNSLLDKLISTDNPRASFWKKFYK